MNIEISRRPFWRFINKKFNGMVHNYHVLSVISILFDEITQDLKDGKRIKINNLGTLFIFKTMPKKYHSVVHRKIMMSAEGKILKFEISKELKKKLIEFLDLDKTFGDD